jgi:hypothetical protein
LFVTHLLFVGGTGAVRFDLNIVEWIPLSWWKDEYESSNNGRNYERRQRSEGDELMGSTAFVASCLVISMIAAQNTSRREGVKGAVGLIKGSGNLV